MVYGYDGGSYSLRMEGALVEANGYTWLTIPQFLKVINNSISRSHVTKMLRDDVLPGFRLGQVWMVRSDAFDTVFEQQRRERRGQAA